MSSPEFPGRFSLRFRLVDLDAYLEARTSRTWERVNRRGRPAKEKKEKAA
jgi:hypothetical protein